MYKHVTRSAFNWEQIVPILNSLYYNILKLPREPDNLLYYNIITEHQEQCYNIL